MNRSFLTRAAAALAALTLWSAVAAAQSVQDFYKGKTKELLTKNRSWTRKS
jgi:hypothetical protein